jgi:hypothetical protein
VNEYTRPRLVDYGTLEELTATAYPLLGAIGQADMSFSAAQTTTPAGGGETQLQPAGASTSPTGDGGAPTGDTEGGGGSGDGGGGSGGEGDAGTGSGGGGSNPAGASGGGDSGGGGTLPFTGFAAGALAAVGAGMAGAGRFLRRNLQR